jgi:hypothetical protein
MLAPHSRDNVWRFASRIASSSRAFLTSAAGPDGSGQQRRSPLAARLGVVAVGCARIPAAQTVPYPNRSSLTGFGG